MNRPKRIYLDNNATTVVDPAAYARMCEATTTYFANPSSVHRSGQEAKAQLIKARIAIASAFGVTPHEIVFTATATEALNLVLRGYLSQHPSCHVITSNLEHAAVFHTLTALQSGGHEVTFLEGGMYGAVRPEAVAGAVRGNTKLICLVEKRLSMGDQFIAEILEKGRVLYAA